MARRKVEHLGGVKKKKNLTRGRKKVRKKGGSLDGTEGENVDYWERL